MSACRTPRRLAALIQSRLDAGESLRSLADRAHRASLHVSHGYINNLHRGHVRTAPSLDMIGALAAALDTDEAEVRSAVFADYYGYDADGGVLAVPGDLTDTERAELDRLVRAWLIARRNG